VRHLAYPYGACGLREEHLAKESGYLSAVTTRHGQLSGGQLNQFALPRIGISSGFDTEISFAAKMNRVQLAAQTLLARESHASRLAWPHDSGLRPA
jgi:hypothetical protein